MLVSLSPTRLPPSDPNFSIEMVKDCLTAAIQRGASDVHIQPRSRTWDVSFRIDGVLQPVDSFERSEASDPVARLMALAGLPSYRAGVPQEGPLRWQGGDGEEREMRVGIFPTVHGKRAAIRIMDGRESIRHLDRLGFDSEIQRQLQSVCESRDGWLLVAGPAGSGKTTTLYACLSQIAAGEFRRSVLTIEDPIESVIDSISQSQLQETSGLTLASAMRAAVRQDAEVLLVSEIRDVETAEAVLAASMTGHLCFSSIHAGSIGATLRRLVQMELPTFAIQSGLRGVLCQRLLRRSCTTCRGDAKTNKTSGCDLCHGTGYLGRVPIAQMVTFDGTSTGQSVFDALISHRPAPEIDQVASQSGIESLRDQANRLVDEGQTDAAEVFRVLGRAS
ncbi:GspE/PulE family protein [Aporhodopirellula aestuarii]|uniref:Flp pilus assembly complex ATPase component TadA n=1 Tax=Aporhodopirellula aestuarii TaxID=2950107 RepID=A0ABT0U9Z7_9BACT|nr:ATPase, T2SS/T4P/T4SS family [Aporhodopirellula aestuarii]MCM2373166.1 Flp pilus assembly complex ATPase component TadA [Aporhodopirellula aestuarii]